MDSSTKTADLLRQADAAISTLRSEKTALQAELEASQPKLARLEELETMEVKRAQASRIVSMMVDTGQCAPEAREEKVAELIEREQPEIDTIEQAVKLLRDGDLGKVGELLGTETVADPTTQFYATFLGEAA